MAYSNPNLLSDVNSGFESGTHTWTAGSNTTLSVVAGQNLGGTQSLRLTPTAAGTVTATSPRVLVTAGTTYVVRMPIRTSAATAGKVFTARITWYNAASGGTSLGNSDAVVAVTAQSGWWLANYGYVVANAPAGALSAALVVTVANVPLAEYVNIDDVYVAPASLIAGNLLSYNTSSMEQDVSGWAITNGTLTKWGGNLLTNSGYNLAAASSTAAGDVYIRLAATVPVTPGVEYLGYVWASSPTSTLDSVLVGLRWYDSGGAQVGTGAERSWSVAADGLGHRLNAVGVAPAGAVSCRLYVRPQTTAAAQSFYFDHAFLGAAPNAASNMLTYDEFSTEMTLPAWTVDGPAPAPTQAPLYLSHPLQDGGYTLGVTPTAPGLISVSLDRLIPATPGQTYKASSTVWFYSNSDPNAIATARVRLDWYDPSGVLVLAANPPPFYSNSSAVTGYGGVSVWSTGKAPTGAAFGKFTVELMHTPATTVTAYYIDNNQWALSDPAYELVVSDAAGLASLSVFAVPGQGVTGTYTLRRVHQDGHMSPVRGYVGDLTRVPFTQSPIVVEDYEAPMGETVWYNLEWFNGAGTKTETLATGVVSSPILADPDYVWLKSPGIPALNTRVLMESAIKWSRAARSTTLDIVGRTNPVSISSKRAGGTSSLSVLVWDTSAHEQLNALLDSGLPALIQAMPGYGVDGNLYLAVGDVDSDPVMDAANVPGWRWTLNVTKIDRPSGGVQGSALATWQTILDGYATWADVYEAFDTWADVLLTE
ncbi:hypothetical protein OHA79_09580 [Streptomyces sp. NBC_00841]|uniref:hypothetical protein n=1 Tax=Streptomyces sp. NBC_00841 TaxID=2975847 RepID=UPI002DDBCCC4|nr:hypothetical protein [Streptomyces sp. NBC_00841]WRZ98065.1 hypothetical protein OHA79_09580 [Streptomyces sp. NBC_00841]